MSPESARSRSPTRNTKAAAPRDASSTRRLRVGQPVLEDGVCGASKACQEPPVAIAAPQEHVLPVVQPQSVALKRVHGSTEPRTDLREGDGQIPACAVERCRDPCQTAADHYDAP